MYCIILKTHDPFFNLAAEDWLLHNRKEDFFILGVNNPSVIIGKHQVLHREVNTQYTLKKNIPVIRRISGGGTVFHDRGNLNYAFVKQSEAGKQVDFKLYTQPVISFLLSLGVNAIFEGKNDLTVDSLKISGNAEHVFRDRVLHHGTLLFDASQEDMKNSLRQNTWNYSTKAVGSNRTSVTNLKNRLRNINDINAFITGMMDYFRHNFPDVQTYTLSGEEIKAIQSLSESKYKTWEWNYGYAPPYTFTSWFVLSGKTYHCRFMVRDGIIWECDIEGSDEMKATGKKLVGCRHMHVDLLKVFHADNIPVSDEEVFNLF